MLGAPGSGGGWGDEFGIGDAISVGSRDGKGEDISLPCNVELRLRFLGSRCIDVVSDVSDDGIGRRALRPMCELGAGPSVTVAAESLRVTLGVSKAE